MLSNHLADVKVVGVRNEDTLRAACRPRRVENRGNVCGGGMAAIDDRGRGERVVERPGTARFAGYEDRAVTGWIGQQAGSATVPGGAEDALQRP